MSMLILATGLSVSASATEAQTIEQPSAFVESTTAYTEVVEAQASPTDEPTTEQATEISTEVSTVMPTERPTATPITTVDPVNSFSYSNVTTTSITLNWEENPKATGYVIYRMDNTTNSKYVKYAVIKGSNITSYTNSNLTPARCYYYQIKAYTQIGQHFYYSTAKTVKLGTCPNGVENLRLTEATKVNQISISWDKVNGASGYIVYRMDYTTNSKYKATSTIIGNKTTTFVDNNVESGRPYYYRVRAYKDVYGAKFYGAYPTLKTATLPETPQNLKVKSQSTNNINIIWDKVPRATGYIVYRMDSTTNSKYKRYATVSTNSFNDTGLIAGRCYYYRVMSYRYVDGKNYYGGYPTLKTGTKTVVPSFTLSSTDTTITATWNKVSGAEGYSFYLANSKDAHYYLQGSSTTNSYTCKGLVKGRTYYVRVCAYNLVDGKKIYSGYQTKSIACKSTVHGYDVGDTYIEISIDQQHMWYYKNGVCIVSTDVVTGMKNSHDTTKGLFYIWQRKSPARLVGATWDTYVNYWLAVTYDGIGIHDSTWRTGGYGGNIYTYDGSHGCINTPYDQVKKIYDNCTMNTPVVIY